MQTSPILFPTNHHRVITLQSWCYLDIPPVLQSMALESQRSPKRNRVILAPYCRVTKSFILLLPPIQSLRSEWVSHTPPLYNCNCSPHLLAPTPLQPSTVIILWVYSCLFHFQSLLQLSHSIFYYHQTVYSFNYIVLHRSSCSTLHHSIWNKQHTS